MGRVRVSENTDAIGVDASRYGDEPSRRLAAALVRLDGYRRHRSRSGPGAADMRLLWLLIESGPQTLSQITADLGLERSTVNRQVNAAVAAGLLAKQRIPRSSAYQITPTAQGCAAFGRGAQSALTAIGETLKEMGPTDSAQLLDLMERFADAYGRRSAEEST